MYFCELYYNKSTYMGAIFPSFDGFKAYLKPVDVHSALEAELYTGIDENNLTQPEVQSFVDFAKSDWNNARYRIDIDTSLKMNTTMFNKDIPCALAVAYSAAYQLCLAQRSRGSLGAYSKTWSESIKTDTLTATMGFSDSLLDNCNIKTTGKYPIRFIIRRYTDDSAISTPQLAIIHREISNKPVFNALRTEGKRLYTLLSAYSVLKNTEIEDLGLGVAKKPKNGYFSINLNSKTAADFAGIEHVKSKTAKSAVNMGVYQTIEDVRDAHPEKNTAWIESCNYQIVTDDTLDNILSELWAAPILSFDTETTGLNINFLSRAGLADELVGVCISGTPGSGYYFPVQHKLFDNLCNGDHRYFMEHCLKKLLETKPIICHNLSYDWKVAYIYDINVNCVFDTLLAFGVTKRYEYIDFPLGLKEICHRLFNIDMFEIEDFVIGEWKGSGITFADLPYDLVKHYGPADADITLRVYKWCLDQHLLDNYKAKRVFDLEVNFSKVVAYSEFWGYHIDVAQLPALEKEIDDGMTRNKQELFKIAGKEFNPNSSVQLSKIIYQELYPQLITSNIVSKASTAKDILHEVEAYKLPNGDYVYPFVHYLLEYRRYETTYKNFLKKKDKYITPDGYVFAGVQQLGTDTGRVSIREPNYQSYNDVVKKRVTGRPGYYIFDCDFAQVEYRVLASMSGQDALIKAFDDPDLDYHTHQAARMFSIPYAAVSKQLRQQSKGINFGLPYGMGDASLGARVFGARTPENTAKAADLRKRFFEGQEKIQDFFTRVRDQGVKNGYTETWLGRRRYYHREVFSEASIRRQAGNHVIQGCIHGRSMIQTKELGIVPIEAVAGETLQVWDGNAWTRGDITYSGKKRKCIVRFTDGREFICSPDHKFAVVSHRGAVRFVPCSELVSLETASDPSLVHRVKTSSDYISPDTQGITSEAALEATHDQHTFGRCLLVDSVEMTDDYIDMYDVCNTDRGYFVADGIVTHNSSADIWKLAVTRLFNRVVKEGLLGKVLFNCFIHDELMGEVSVDIDPYIFIKMWREEYEVVIDKFCRLYAGFGWGSSWYEAKKADYPPQFIDTLVAKAGVDTSWDGDYKKLIAKTKQDLYDFETKRVVDWYQSSPKGTILAPHIGGYLYSKLADWWEDLVKADPSLDNYILKAKKGSPKTVATLDQAFEWFCRHENIPFKPGWILSPEDAEVTKAPSSNTTAQGTTDPDEDAETARLEAEHQKLVCQQVYNMGFYLDVTYNMLVLNYNKPRMQVAAMQIINNYCQTANPDGLQLVLMTFDVQGYATGYPQKYRIALKDFAMIQEIIRLAL